MENITIGQITTLILGLGALIGGIEYILVRIKKVVKKILEPVNQRLDDLELSSGKDYLVRYLKYIEQGREVDEVETERFYEVLQRYKELGGNSYLSHKIEKLQKEGKL